MNSVNSEEVYFKVIFLGNQKVGKTSIFRRILDLEPTLEYIPTIGVQFHNLDVLTSNHSYIQLWDVSGSEIYSDLLPSYLKGTAIVVLVFDYKNKESQTEIIQLYDQISESISSDRILLIGNKSENEKKEIPKTMDSWIDKHNKFILPLSAKENIGTSLLLKNIIRIIQSLPNDQRNQK